MSCNEHEALVKRFGCRGPNIKLIYSLFYKKTLEIRLPIPAIVVLSLFTSLCLAQKSSRHHSFPSARWMGTRITLECAVKLSKTNCYVSAGREMDEA
jgi:hypothetical protein